jgi:hypothetical protein
VGAKWSLKNRKIGRLYKWQCHIPQPILPSILALKNNNNNNIQRKRVFGNCYVSNICPFKYSCLSLIAIIAALGGGTSRKVLLSWVGMMTL